MTRIRPSTLTSYIARHCSGIGRLDRVGAERAAGVVDQHVHDVEPATASARAATEAVVGHVAGDRDAADLLGQRLDPVGTASGAHHPEALRGEGARGGGADPARGSGDDGGPGRSVGPLIRVLVGLGHGAMIWMRP